MTGPSLLIWMLHVVICLDLSTDVLVEHLGGQEELDGGLQDVVAAGEEGQGQLQDGRQHGGVEEVQEAGGRRLGRHWGLICQEE